MYLLHTMYVYREGGTLQGKTSLYSCGALQKESEAVAAICSSLSKQLGNLPELLHCRRMMLQVAGNRETHTDIHSQMSCVPSLNNASRKRDEKIE